MNKLEQAMEDHRQGKIQQAEAVYQEILQDEPENSEIWYLLATAQMGQNNMQEALVSVDKAIEYNEKAPAYLQLKGGILARLGETDKAIKTLSTAVKDNPNLYQAHITLGHLLYAKAEKKEAIKHFTMAQKINPKNPEAKVNLAKVKLDEGEIQKAIDVLRAVEQEHPEQASVKMMIGQAFLEKGAYSFAENYFQKVLAMHPDYNLAGLYLGIAKLESGDAENAQKLIITFNDQFPNTREGLAALGLLMFKSNRFQTAVEYLRRAIGPGAAPISWRAAFVESLARLGQYKAAVEFYEKIEKKFNDKQAEYRLAELYELQGKIDKAKKQYKKIKNNDSKYLSALLGLTRCYLQEKKAEKAEKKAKKILETNAQHAEATLLYLTSLLFQAKQSKALTVLEAIDYSKYNDVYKKTFRMQHGLILDNKEKYSKAMKVFTDKSKTEQQPQIQPLPKVSEEELKLIQNFKTKIDDDRKDPIFIIGAQSTAINQFILWLNSQGVAVLNDRLISLGRPDVLYGQQQIKVLSELDDDKVRIERKLYHQKARVLMTAFEENTLFADCMYINPMQMSLVKKFFPKAKVLLLSRDTADIWLNQKVFGQEPIDSKEWNESVNQIISMGLDLVQVDMDKWLENDKETLKELSSVFSTELKKNQEDEQKYWRKTLFPKGHWKNYKDFLGQ